jgi:hypothetical protein
MVDHLDLRTAYRGFVGKRRHHVVSDPTERVPPNVKSGAETCFRGPIGGYFGADNRTTLERPWDYSVRPFNISRIG